MTMIRILIRDVMQIMIHDQDHKISDTDHKNLDKCHEFIESSHKNYDINQILGKRPMNNNKNNNRVDTRTANRGQKSEKLSQKYFCRKALCDEESLQINSPLALH